jgi:hypothetical protein
MEEGDAASLDARSLHAEPDDSVWTTSLMMPLHKGMKLLGKATRSQRIAWNATRSWSLTVATSAPPCSIAMLVRVLQNARR